MARLQSAIKALSAPDAPHYDFICLDHVDDIANMVEDDVCQRMGIESLSDASYGKGWKAYRKGIYNIVAPLKRINSGIVFIAHETIKTVRARGLELERTMPDLSKAAWKTIVPLADIVGYCGFAKIKEAGKLKEVRVLYTQPREDLYAKDRTSRKRIGEHEMLDGKVFVSTFSRKQ